MKKENEIKIIDVSLKCDSGAFSPKISAESMKVVEILQEASNRFQDVLYSLNEKADKSLQNEVSNKAEQEFAPLDFN